EPARRCLSSLVAGKPLARLVARSGSLHLPARLAGSATEKPAALARRPTHRFCGWARGRLPGPGLADRAVRRAAVESPHVAAPLADDGCASAGLDGGAAVPDVARPALASTHLLGRATASVAHLEAVLRAADSPGGGAAAICRRHVALACAGS